MVAQNARDIDRIFPFYADTLGLDFVSGMQTSAPAENVYDPEGGLTSCDGALFEVRGDNRVSFDWLAWDGEDGSPAYAEPNHLGIVRIVMEVDDIDASREILEASRWGAAALNLAEVEEWDLGPFGVRRMMPFTDPEGVGFALMEQPSSPFATLHPYVAS